MFIIMKEHVTYSAIVIVINVFLIFWGKLEIYGTEEFAISGLGSIGNT